MMKIHAAIQAERTGRVYVIYADRGRYLWARAAAGETLRGPFPTLARLFVDMAQTEGRTADHWREAFAAVFPDLITPPERGLAWSGQVQSGVSA